MLTNVVAIRKEAGMTLLDQLCLGWPLLDGHRGLHECPGCRVMLRGKTMCALCRHLQEMLLGSGCADAAGLHKFAGRAAAAVWAGITARLWIPALVLLIYAVVTLSIGWGDALAQWWRDGGLN